MTTPTPNHENTQQTFDQWLQTGIDNKWIGPPVCSTHDGIPMSQQEEQQWEQGNDPCHHILRLYENEQTADNTNHDYTPYKWRHPQTPPPNTHQPDKSNQ